MILAHRAGPEILCGWSPADSARWLSAAGVAELMVLVFALLPPITAG
jgi:hypothetical protein